MAVFTAVQEQEARQWLAGFDLGELTELRGIASGIENTNYFLTTTRGRYVLTLFERLSAEQLPFYLGLMQHLAQHGVACPAPIADRQGRILGTLNGKPAALVTRLAGEPVEQPTALHCRQVGELLAKMHAASLSFSPELPNQRGLPWWLHAAPQVMPFLSSEQAALLADELATQQAFAASANYRALTRSAVHADLFRDNVLFEGLRLGGAIDFYFAGTDTQWFDLAVTCNDWCIDAASGALNPERLEALLQGYELHAAHRPEGATWHLMLRAAALRFWLSRLYDFHLPRPAEMVTPKDPSHFERVLRARRDSR
jgi:homoserine kinase type II